MVRSGLEYYSRYDSYGNAFALLQVCNSFYLLLIKFTAEKNLPFHDKVSDYTVELLCSWKNYHKQRELIKLDLICFGFDVSWAIYKRKRNQTREARIYDIISTLIQAIDTNDFKYEYNLSKYKPSYRDEIRNIPILKACGIASCVNPEDIYHSIEEYFSLEKQSQERTESVGITDKERIENHGFDVKTSFRGK